MYTLRARRERAGYLLRAETWTGWCSSRSLRPARCDPPSRTPPNHTQTHAQTHTGEVRGRQVISNRGGGARAKGCTHVVASAVVLAAGVAEAGDEPGRVLHRLLGGVGDGGDDGEAGASERGPEGSAAAEVWG